MLPKDTFRRSESVIELHLSLNGGLSVESNPQNIPVSFTILMKPYIISTTLTGGYSTTTTSYITIGRSESKTVVITGRNMNSLTAKNPVCLFSNQFTTPITITNDNQVEC
jgi:hypothetical protein